MAEKDANQFLDQSVPADGWGKFRETLIGLTDVTRNHFDKLVQVSNLPNNLHMWRTSMLRHLTMALSRVVLTTLT